jgi:hypothetical protein
MADLPEQGVSPLLRRAASTPAPVLTTFGFCPDKRALIPSSPLPLRLGSDLNWCLFSRWLTGENEQNGMLTCPSACFRQLQRLTAMAQLSTRLLPAAFACIRGYLSTLRKQGVTLLAALEALFAGQPLYPQFA